MLMTNHVIAARSTVARFGEEKASVRLCEAMA
jgi:hypothetical protein